MPLLYQALIGLWDTSVNKTRDPQPPGVYIGWVEQTICRLKEKFFGMLKKKKKSDKWYGKRK